MPAQAPEAKFEPGDTVAWSHELAASHAKGSILREDALPAATATRPAVPVGKVVDFGNDARTWFVVEFPPEHLAHPAVQEAAGTHPEPTKLTLTGEELVKVSGDPTDALEVTLSDPSEAELVTALRELAELRAENARLKETK